MFTCFFETQLETFNGCVCSALFSCLFREENTAYQYRSGHRKSLGTDEELLVDTRFCLSRRFDAEHAFVMLQVKGRWAAATTL
eukprot:5602704-Amphidinium_carterae.1